jgi:ATP-dependent exoDNAse (exonuclease V) alpha subunit
MGQKSSDPEAPRLSHHEESSISIEKQEGDAATARAWARDMDKSTTTSTKLKNPLALLSREQLLSDVEAFAKEKDLEHILDDLRKGALIAQDPRAFEQMDELTEGEKELLRREKTHRWHQPFMMYFMTGKSSSRFSCWI